MFLLDVARIVGAVFFAWLGIASLRVAINLMCSGAEEIANRRNPENYRKVVTGVYVNKEGQMVFKMGRRYVGYPEHD